MSNEGGVSTAEGGRSGWRRWGACCLAGLLVGLTAPASAQSLADQVRRLEATGNALQALTLLEEEVQRQGDAETLRTYAEFLDRHGDARARSVYQRLVKAGGAEPWVLRRLALLDLLAGDREAAIRRLEAYHRAGGTDLPPEIPKATAIPAPEDYIEIPGPLESFSRMAAFSSELEPDDVLPAIARNVITSGYRVTASYEGLQPTEYMKLLQRYLSQARELEKLADDTGVIRINECDSTQTADLLRVLGYRMRGGCGAEVILETVNASRAFLTIDSGFPLAELEQALRTNRPFTYDYRPSRIPILHGANYWLTQKDKKRYPAFIDAFLADPSLCRLYLALSKMDPETVEALRKVADLEFLKAFAHVLDFFGSLFEIQDGKALTPGGERARAVWAELVGVSPDRGGEFFKRLVALDDGWMASYYDALRRIEGPVLDYLTEPARLRRFYLAIRGKVTSPGPARPVFRSNADLMLLTTRLRLEADGRPHVPGGLGVWKQLFAASRYEVYDKKLKKTAPLWDDADDVIEALFALCRKPVDNQPLKMFMALSDIDRRRKTPLKPETVELLIRQWRRFGDQYPLFAETGALRDETIRAFLEAARQIDREGDRLLRSDAAGVFQALTGLWQIGVRHGVIPEDEADGVLASIIQEFSRITNRRELFDQTRRATETLLTAIGPGGESRHDRIFKLLAGSMEPGDAETYELVASQMWRIFEAQKLVTLDTIFDVADHLEELAQGAQLNTAIINRFERRLEDLRPYGEGLSSVEKNAISFGYWAERHLNQQRKLDLRREIRRAIGSPEKLRNLRALLTGVLRDTLVGYNYIHYAPPGAQLLQTNPLFVRSHDFIGTAGANETWREAAVYGTGWPSSAGGRLVGSLAGLPYALAQAEQNFLVPRNEQALIWGDLVPQMMVAAKVPRWWHVPPPLMHWVALHVRLAKAAVAEAVLDPERREVVISELRRHASPARVKEVAALLAAGDAVEALDHITPSELFLLGRMLAQKPAPQDPLRAEIRRLEAEHPREVNMAAASRAFGSPKPKLTNSYHPELLNLRTFPTLMGYSSRIMAESWESNLIFFATLADGLYMRPSQLNAQVPEWTRKTVETIFATHLEDWPAVLRSLRKVGEEVRAAWQRPAGSVERASLGER